MDFSQPPPGMGFARQQRHAPNNYIRHSFMYQPRPIQMSMSQDDFDGKRLRKSVMRKTVDYNASIIKALETRVWQRDFRDRHALQPDAMYAPDLLPPPSYPDNPINAVTTRFVKTASNKMRCPIFAVAWTPEGRRLVTGASSGEFTLWNGLTFNFETILQAHDSPVRSMVWSRSEGWMVTGDHCGYVKYWQSNMNNVKMFQAHKEAVRGISFSPSDTKIVTCSDDGTLRIFDFYRCQEERILRGHGADVKCVQWHPTKSLIVSGSKDNQQPIKLWDPKSGEALATLHAHKSTVMDLRWNENGNWLITASRDHLLKLFDIRKLGTELQIFRGHKKEASSVAWHPTHEGLFCSGGSDGAILFWNVGTDKEVGCIEGAHESIVWTLAWHPLGHILCSGSNDHTSKFWTRNRPGDQMRDKYNLNTLPPGISDDQELDEPANIPGMGPEDKVEIFTSSTDKAIPGLDLDTSVLPIEIEKKVKKVPYSKPIPRNFQAQWNHGTGEESTTEALTQALMENVPGVVPLQQIAPSAIIIYGKLVPVESGSKLEQAIADGPQALKKFIASGEIEELHDVMPHMEDDDEETNAEFVYPENVIQDEDLRVTNQDTSMENENDSYQANQFNNTSYDSNDSYDNEYNEGSNTMNSDHQMQFNNNNRGFNDSSMFNAPPPPPPMNNDNNFSPGQANFNNNQFSNMNSRGFYSDQGNFIQGDDDYFDESGFDRSINDDFNNEMDQSENGYQDGNDNNWYQDNNQRTGMNGHMNNQRKQLSGPQGDGWRGGSGGWRGGNNSNSRGGGSNPRGGSSNPRGGSSMNRGGNSTPRRGHSTPRGGRGSGGSTPRGRGRGRGSSRTFRRGTRGKPY